MILTEQLMGGKWVGVWWNRDDQPSKRRAAGVRDAVSVCRGGRGGDFGAWIRGIERIRGVGGGSKFGLDVLENVVYAAVGVWDEGFRLMRMPGEKRNWGVYEGWLVGVYEKGMVEVTVRGEKQSVEIAGGLLVCKGLLDGVFGKGVLDWRALAARARDIAPGFRTSTAANVVTALMYEMAVLDGARAGNKMWRCKSSERGTELWDVWGSTVVDGIDGGKGEEVLSKILETTDLWGLEEERKKMVEGRLGGVREEMRMYAKTLRNLGRLHG